MKPPFTSVFSFSTTVEVDPDAKVAQVSEIVELFPGLKDGLEDVSEDTPLVLVRNFTARETVLVGGYILLGRRDVPAKCAFVLWHDDDDPFTPPVAVEFSFKYESTDEDYRGSVTRDAFEVIRVLHHELADWAHPDPKTKTAFVYG